MFADPWNPSSSEVHAWAYTNGATEPCEDWDLALSWGGQERDYLEFVAAPNCPNRDYFLHVLYLMIGDAVRSNFRMASEPLTRGFIELAADSRSDLLQLWRKRALHLLQNPAEFKYTAWCGGALARDRP